MKIILTAIIILSIALCWGNQEQKEMSPLQKYFAEQSSENFLNAYNSLNTQVAEDEASNSISLAMLLFYEMEKQLKNAEETATDLNPGQKFQYANLLLALNRFEESVKIYDMLNTASPKWSCPWRHKGEAYFQMNELEKAEEALLMAIETREEHYDAYVMLADVQAALGRFDDALKTLELGFTYKGKDIEDPDQEVNDLDVQFLYLNLLQKNGKTTEYSTLREKLEKIVPGDDRLNP
ncbi:MAG: hypothetical protein PHR06_11375 [Candidatus Cloacimonetes bacterium]|nr:hypothetical protein [Candidatus Cloacimonadota bacterium]